MRTLVLSDLHLGGRGAPDVLRRPRPLAELCERLDGVDRLVLLGDVVELRHGPAHRAVEVAAPVLTALGDALAPGADVVLLAGNHDHAIVAPWLASRGDDGPPAPLRLEERLDGAGVARLALARRLAACLGAHRTEVAYPGVWLREDVYATHGHYLDRLTTIPTIERLAAGVMNRVVGPVPEHATPDDFEAALGPMYAWLGNVANQPGGAGWRAERANPSAKAWTLLSGDGHRPLSGRALAALLPLGTRTANRLGLGPVRPTLTGDELRRAMLRAMGEVVHRLDVRARHVVFGHTHRAGPLPGDAPHEWRAGGAQLVNGGAWVDETVFAPDGPEHPHWPGRGVIVDADGPPRVERLVTDPGR